MPSIPTRVRPLRLASLAMALALAAAGCGAGMSGRYATEDGLGDLEFESGGRVYMTMLGGTVACEYEVDGDRVIVKGPHGSHVLKREGDRLEGGPGLSFVKR
jgi:hypothetical protein